MATHDHDHFFLSFLSRLRSNEQVVREPFVVLKSIKLHSIAEKMETKNRQSHISRITGVFLFKNITAEKKVLFNRCAILLYLLKALLRPRWRKKMNIISSVKEAPNHTALSQ